MLLMAILQAPKKQIVNDFGYKRIRTNGEEFEEYVPVANLKLDPQLAEEGEPAPLDMQCTYCETELSYDNEIAPKLFRCPNEVCGHMNFDASGIPEKKSMHKEYI